MRGQKVLHLLTPSWLPLAHRAIQKKAFMQHKEGPTGERAEQHRRPDMRLLGLFSRSALRFFSKLELGTRSSMGEHTSYFLLHHCSGSSPKGSLPPAEAATQLSPKREEMTCSPLCPTSNHAVEIHFPNTWACFPILGTQHMHG